MGTGNVGPNGESPDGASIAAARAAAAHAAPLNLTPSRLRRARVAAESSDSAATHPHLDGASSLERALDEATERYSNALGQQRALRRAEARGAALAERSGHGALSLMPGRLRWRGLEVSEEFQRYAERVARGEELSPYRGQVLARYCAAFPWVLPDAPPPAPEPAPAPPRSLVTAALLAAGAWVVGTLLISPSGPSSSPELLSGAERSMSAADRPSAYGRSDDLAFDDVEPSEQRGASASEGDWRGSRWQATARGRAGSAGVSSITRRSRASRPLPSTQPEAALPSFDLRANEAVEAAEVSPAATTLPDPAEGFEAAPADGASRLALQARPKAPDARDTPSSAASLGKDPASIQDSALLLETPPF